MRRNVLLLCVNYKNDRETVAFLKAISEQDKASELYAVVADNSTVPSSGVPEPARELPTTRQRWLVTGSNLGYFGGMNFAYKKALQAFPTTPFEYVVVSNTDISCHCDNFRIEESACESGARSYCAADYFDADGT